MNTKKYFNKNSKIYGISQKFDFGQWIGYKIVFSDYNKALNWLNAESCNFMQRELVSKTVFNRCKYDLRNI